MYLRVQLFHLDNITIHLAFFFYLRKRILQPSGSSGEWGKKKSLISRSQIRTAQQPHPHSTDENQFFTWLQLQIHASPAAVNCRRGRWFMLQKQTIDPGVALPVWFYGSSV